MVGVTQIAKADEELSNWVAEGIEMAVTNDKTLGNQI